MNNGQHQSHSKDKVKSQISGFNPMKWLIPWGLHVLFLTLGFQAHQNLVILVFWGFFVEIWSWVC